ncbi:MULTISPECIES: TPM domain-containing protein [Cyanophyceae]|uniref:TPM domain-containing protein n=1 Tax=Stenomitos frigidus AS-A4 TaxID=2933935 RepID=A0ABV0KMK9_9CYAN|nr:TPM domain-containing protein [Phormidium sp. FACHB-592]
MSSLAMQSQKIFYVGCTCLFMISTPLMSLAVTVESVLNPRQTDGGWVSDTANILNASTENKLNQAISQLEAKNGTEIAVVTVPKTSPSETPKAFATQLFNHWKIGKAGQNNGVLFLISKGDRRVEIETGYGIEAILPNAQVSEMIQQKIVPSFKQGNFDQGTLNGTNALITTLETKTFSANATAVRAPITRSAVSTNPAPSSSKTDAFNWVPFLVFVSVGSLLLLSLITLAKGRQSDDDDDDDHRGGRGRHSASNHLSSHYNSTIYGGSTGSAGSTGGSTGGGSTGGGFGGGSSGGGGAGGGF